MIPDCPSDAIAFIGECLKWDPTKRATAAQLIGHPFLSKENAHSGQHSPHTHQMHLKKLHSMGDGPNPASYKLEREPGKGFSPLKAISEKNPFDKDDEFDELLKDFKGYRVGGKKEEGRETDNGGKGEDEDEWF